MTCPNCGSENTGCIDSRTGKRKRRRRYVCQDCGGRFTTYEIYAADLQASADAMQRMLEGCRGQRKRKENKS